MIRLLTKEDAEKYWDLRLQALQVNPEAFVTTYEEAIRQENPIKRVESNLTATTSCTFGAFNEENHLVGVVTLLTEEREAYKHKGHIVAMYVDAQNRRNGLARELITNAIQRARDIKLEQLTLGVVSTNEPAKKLYESMGFKTYGIEKRAIKVNGVYSDDRKYGVVSLKEGYYHERTAFRKRYEPQLGNFVCNSYVIHLKRLQRLVEGIEKNELSYKGSENNENNIGQLLQHLAVVDLHWVYRLKGEGVPPELENKYGPMLNEMGELPSLRKYKLQELMQDYEAVQHMFYEECMKLTENDLTREVFYEKGENATIRWGIWHIADHNRYHQAHISRLRKLYRSRPHI